MDRPLREILSKFENHDPIIMTYTTFTGKCIITIEVSPSKYWLRIYKDEKLYRQKSYKHFKDAVGSFYRYIKKLNFKYNYYKGGLKHHEHK